VNETLIRLYCLVVATLLSSGKQRTTDLRSVGSIMGFIKILY